MSSSPVDWSSCLQHAAVTDVGMRRSNNQDSYAVVLATDPQSWYRRGHMFIVADGMGAHAAGELASKLAVDGIPHLYHKYHDKSPPEALLKAVQETNTEVHRRGQANADFHNMGTTSSVLALLPQGALVAHIGDSRVYRLRGDTLRQLTFDHSLVWEMRASGQLPPGVEASSVVPKNVITRSLGPNASVKVDIEGPYPTQVGDTFLMCSDGLTARIEDDEIGSILANVAPQEAAQLLVDLANLRGGPDNITVIVLKVTGQQITSAVAGGEPLVIGAEVLGERSVHPALWVITGVCFLAAIVMAILNFPVAAIVAGCGGVIGLTAGILQKFGSLSFGPSKEVVLAGGKRLGTGPHTSTKVAVGPEFIDKLRAIVEKVREAGALHHWDIDWRRVTDLCHRASDAKSAGDQRQALRSYAAAINTMMQQLRESKKKHSDSHVDLI